MARNKDSSRGQSSRTRRLIREELFDKQLKRKSNLDGSSARSKRVNEKLKV